MHLLYAYANTRTSMDLKVLASAGVGAVSANDVAPKSDLGTGSECNILK